MLKVKLLVPFPVLLAAMIVTTLLEVALVGVPVIAPVPAVRERPPGIVPAKIE
jgi:hypothetical protein